MVIAPGSGIGLLHSAPLSVMLYKFDCDYDYDLQMSIATWNSECKKIIYFLINPWSHFDRLYHSLYVSPSATLVPHANFSTKNQKVGYCMSCQKQQFLSVLPCWLSASQYSCTACGDVDSGCMRLQVTQFCPPCITSAKVLTFFFCFLRPF